MTRHISTIVALLLLVVLFFPSGVYGKGARDTSVPDVCAGAGNSARFRSFSGQTEVLVCPPVVVSGHDVHFLVRGKPFTLVRVQIQYPDGSTTSTPARATDAQGSVLLALPVHYNPIDRSAQAPFVVLVGRGGLIDQVEGAITVAQATPLSTTRLRWRPIDALVWCHGTVDSCTVLDNTQVQIRVDTDPGAQVAVTLQYPDGQSASCSANDVTGTTFASESGLYRCELPVVFQAGKRRGRTLAHVLAQVSIGSYSKTLSQPLFILAG